MFNLFKNILGGESSAELSEALKNKPFLVDVRTPGEFSSGSVKGAVNIPLDRLPMQLEKFKNKNHIVVFCRSGNRSGQAKSILNQKGFTNVINGGTWENVRRAIGNS